MRKATCPKCPPKEAKSKPHANNVCSDVSPLFQARTGILLQRVQPYAAYRPVACSPSGRHFSVSRQTYKGRLAMANPLIGVQTDTKTYEPNGTKLLDLFS